MKTRMMNAAALALMAVLVAGGARAQGLGTAYTLQAFLVGDAGEVLMSRVINVFVTDYLAPEPADDERRDMKPEPKRRDEPKRDPAAGDDPDPKNAQDDRNRR